MHSRYLRTVSDLPWHGISVTFKVHTRRFLCDELSCERKIFRERLPDVAARARKTDRLEEALLAIALELGGRAGARLAEALGIAAACDALLRKIKAALLPGFGKFSGPRGARDQEVHAPSGGAVTIEQVLDMIVGEFF